MAAHQRPEAEKVEGGENQAQAQGAVFARAPASQGQVGQAARGVAEFSITLAMGRADLSPETPASVSGFKRVIDVQKWIITKVIHSLSNDDYTTSLELEVKLSDVEYEIED